MLAAGAHSWAASVLGQMERGEREQLPLVRGGWSCDYGVQAAVQTSCGNAYTLDAPPHLIDVVEEWIEQALRCVECYNV